MPCSPDLLDFPPHFLCCFRRRPLPHFVECLQPALSLLFAERTGKRLQVFHGIFNDLAGRFVQKSGKPFDLLNPVLVERERNFSCHSDYPNHFATARNPRSIKLISRGSSYSNSALMPASFRRAGRAGAEEAAHDDLLAKVCERASKMSAGDPLHPKTRLGAIVSKEQMETVLSYVEAGKSEGAKLVCGGERADIGTGKGYFVKPTVFDDVDPRMRIAREEIFGPVLATIRFKDAEDAIAKGNATVYGLAAAVWTRDVSKAHRVARAIKAGTVWINTYNLYDPALPFGGFKESGFGRDQGKDALEKYTQTKSVWVNL